MKDILDKYPLKFLQQELINIRTGFRLKKKEIVDVLKTMKGIKKLSKDDLIDLLIKYNYDISKLPPIEEVEQIIKQKRGRKPKPKKEVIPDKYPRITDKEREIKKELGSLIKPKNIYNIDYYIDKIDNSGDSIKKKITDVREELQFFKDYYDDRLNKKNENRTKETTSKKIDKFLEYQNERIKKLESYLKSLIEDEKKIFKKKEPTISTGKSQILTRAELEQRKYDLQQRKKQIEEEQIKNLDNYKIFKNPSADQFLQMRNDFDKDKFKWSLEAFQKGLLVEDIIKIANLNESDFKQLNAFFTPDSIIEKMVDYSYFYQNYQSFKNDKKTMNLLEGSGGVGNIIYYLLENMTDTRFLKIDFVEVNDDFIEIAKARLFKYRDIITYYKTSFFDFKPNVEYDYIIGNPPYKLNVKPKTIYDVDFFIKSFEMLNDGGSIIFLISPSSLTLKTESHKKFKELLIKETGTDKKEELIENNDLYEIKENFSKKEKGVKAGLTNIDTFLYIINKNNEDY